MDMKERETGARSSRKQGRLAQWISSCALVVLVLFLLTPSRETTTKEAPLSRKLSKSPLLAPSLVEEFASTHDSVKTKTTFGTIYANDVWEDSSARGGGGGSGPGSTLAYTTRTRALVEMLVFKYNLGLLIDAPCGAMKWMSTVVDYVTNSPAANPDFQYVGLDIVESVIEANREVFENVHNMHFEVKDLSREAIETPPGVRLRPGQKMALFSRDALQHLNFDLVISMMKNMAKTQVDFVIMGSYHGKGVNRNITTGMYFKIDLSKPPFSAWLPAPLEVISEEDEAGKHLAVYDRNDLAHVNFDGLLEDARAQFGKHA